MIGVPSKDLLKAWKAAGFEGIESTEWQASPRDAAAARKWPNRWACASTPCCSAGATSMAAIRPWPIPWPKWRPPCEPQKAYGADTVLYVPCLIRGMPMPNPWLFDIRFDKNTGHLKQVVADNDPKYQKYIEAHDHAIDTSREGIKRLIPMAEKSGVIIAVENVWNNLCVKPELAANFVASFNSPWVRAYFDIGNHVSTPGRKTGFARWANSWRNATSRTLSSTRRPRRHVLRHPRRQHRLARGLRGPRRHRL